jgi:hypothetical protein
MSLFRGDGANGNEYQRAVAEIGRLRHVLKVEQDAHTKTKAKCDELERERDARPRLEVTSRACLSCTETYPDGPAYFLGYLDGSGRADCVACYASRPTV